MRNLYNFYKKCKKIIGGKVFPQDLIVIKKVPD